MTQTLSGSHNAHARLSPSDSKRWTKCSASIAFQEANAHRIPKERNSIYSDEGTEAHDWAAKVLLGELAIEEIPTKFQDPVGDYVKHCLSLAPEGVKQMVEVSVPLYYQGSQQGTCDYAIVTNEKVIIRDYKHGAGVLVKSQENTQLAIYAYSFIKLLEDVYEFSPDTVVDIAVYQPRHREGSQQQPWVLSLADLTAFCESIAKDAERARNAADDVRAKLPLGERDIHPDEIIAASEHAVFHPEDGDEGSCRWCATKAFCSKRLQAATAGLESLHTGNPLDMLEAIPDLTKEEKKQDTEARIEVVQASIGHITEADMVTLYRRSKAIKSFLDDVEEYLSAKAQAGEVVEGTKLVLGREGNRDWANEEAAETFLAGQKIPVDERYTKKLISPTTAEKLLASKELSARAQSRFKELVTRSEAKKVLALADDKRPAVSSDLAALPDLSNEP